MGPLGKVVPQVMPEQVVEHSLCDPGGPHVGDVPLLTNERGVLGLLTNDRRVLGLLTNKSRVLRVLTNER